MSRPSARLPFLLVGGALLVAVPSSTARADTSIRCGTNLVELGAPTSAVESACGPPTTATTVPVVLRGKGRPIRFELTTWIYDLGRLQFTRTLVFRGGLLESIDIGDYGP